MTIGRKELVAKVAEATGLTAADAQRAVAAVESTIIEAAKAGESVKLPGTLSLDIVDRAARTARNPQTGEPIEIAATKAARISAGSALKAAAKESA